MKVNEVQGTIDLSKKVPMEARVIVVADKDAFISNVNFKANKEKKMTEGLYQAIIKNQKYNGRASKVKFKKVGYETKEEDPETGLTKPVIVRLDGEKVKEENLNTKIAEMEAMLAELSAKKETPKKKETKKAE